MVDSFSHQAWSMLNKTIAQSRKMKYVLLLLALVSPIASPCERPLIFMAGPFFTPSMTEQFWAKFLLELRGAVSCDITLKTSNNFKEYINDITENKADIVVTPSHYRKALSENGLSVILATPKTMRGFLVSRLDILNDPSLLIGEEIYTPGIYSRVHLELEIWLEEHNLLNKVHLNQHHSHDASMIYMFKNQHASAAIMGIVYDRLPTEMKNKYNTIEISRLGGGIILVKKDTEKAFIRAILAAAKAIKTISFEPVDNTLPRTERENRLEARFSKIFKDLLKGNDTN